MGGTDDPTNLVELSISEHAEAHRILYEKYGKWEDMVAWKGLAKIIPSEKIHSEATKNGMQYWWDNLSDKEKENWKQRCSNRPNYVPHIGHTYTHTEEAKEKIRQFHKNKKLTRETKIKISKSRKGKAKGKENAMANPENRNKVSISKLGRKRVYMPDGSFKYIKKEGLVDGD